ncbi:MAG: prolyl oligopeptidase family serine peptidase [Bacteroidales bacterium]|jgi:dipeptidyl aminopeptidase/acylaminoacyl peptidase
MKKYIFFLLLILFPALSLTAQGVDHEGLSLAKKIDDVLWYHKVGDVAYIDKVYIPTTPRWKEANPTGQGAGNPLKIWSYIFVPKDINPAKKYPLIVLPHGGVHGDFTTYHTHIIRELMAQGYIVIATEYRGSTGYGRGLYEDIDYGGRENDDVWYGRNYMVENYDIVDKSRIGIIGWSHGGMITLMNLFQHPKDYACGYAGVPVSDLIARLGYKRPSYGAYFSAPYHIGKTPEQDVEEYRRRSPAWHASKLQTPLLIYTNTSDEDVNSLEVEHMIKALKAEGKSFEYKIFEDEPGGHSFDRMDHAAASAMRFDIYKFLAKYLKPPKTFKNINELRRAAYEPWHTQAK